MIIQTLEGFNTVVRVNFKQIHSDPLIAMKKYADAYTMIGPGLNKNGQPETGLTEDRQEVKVGGKIPKTIKGTRRVMEQKLDMAEGALKAGSAYWLAYNVRIGSDPITLDLQDPHDLLKYLFLRAQSIVANGLKEVETNSKVEYVLYSEEQEAESRVNERKILKNAYAITDKLDIETKINVLAVYGFIADATNINTIENKLDEYIEENPKKFLDMINDDDLIFKSLVTKCLDKGILIMEDGAVKHGEVNVGYSKDSAAKAISGDRTLQAILKAKLSGDMNLIQEVLNKKIK